MTFSAFRFALIFLGTVLLVTPSKAEDSLFARNHNAAELGNADAQMKLGLAYEQGHGVSQDNAKAAAWYRRAARQGNAEAQIKLSEAYYVGRGVSQDYLLAGWWLLQAATKRAAAVEAKQREREARAEQGDAEAQAQLRNISAKFMMLIKAAEQGDAEAQSQLGLAYGRGDGVPRDDIKSAAWHRRAAEQGHPTAQSFLAMAYAEGAGVPQDYVEALKWINILLAQTKGSERQVFKMALSFFMKKMTPEQILEAQKLARQWKPTPSK